MNFKKILKLFESEELAEKAKSQAQQQAAGAALAAKRGDIPKTKLTGASKEMLSMSTKELEKFAGTKHKNLPKKVDECDSGMSQENNSHMTVSTNMSSNGDRTVSISATGDRADELLMMLNLAGMSVNRVESSMNNDADGMLEEQDIEEEYANEPEEEYQTVASIVRQGNDLNREKKQFADKPKLGDNPMATEKLLDEELAELLDSILIRNENESEEVEEGLFGDSDADLQARSPQYQQLKAMEPKYKGTEYEKQLADRISTARTRAQMGAGEVMQYDPKTGKQMPKPVLPPEQYKR